MDYHELYLSGDYVGATTAACSNPNIKQLMAKLD